MLGLVLACDPSHGAEPAQPREGPRCGDGVVDPTEACDLGFANAPDGPCRDDCRQPVCGDGLPDPGERCDDGNDDDHDDCRRDCRRPLRSTWIRIPGGGPQPEGILGLAPTLDDGVVAVGTGQEHPDAAVRGWLAGYAPDGDTRWQRWLPDDDAWSSATASAVAIDPEGDVWVAGWARGERHDDVWVSRCDPQGVPRWTFLEDFGGNRDRAVAIALRDGGAVVAGEVLRHGQDRDALVLGFDGEGQRVLTWRHDGPAGAIDDARAIAVTPDGGLVVGGGEDDLTSWWIAKLDADGEELGFSRERGEVGAWVSAIAVAPDGELWLAGTEVLAAPEPDDPSSWHAQPWLARLDAAGRVVWRRDEPPAGAVRREAFGVTVDPDGGATLVGTDPLPGATCSRRDCPGRLWTASYDAHGRRRWFLRPDEMTRGEGRAVARGSDGSLWLGGSRRVVFSESDAWLGRYREEEPPP